jgi:hypothetical protein
MTRTTFRADQVVNNLAEYGATPADVRNALDDLIDSGNLTYPDGDTTGWIITAAEVANIARNLELADAAADYTTMDRADRLAAVRDTGADPYDLTDAEIDKISAAALENALDQADAARNIAASARHTHPDDRPNLDVDAAHAAATHAITGRAITHILDTAALDLITITTIDLTLGGQTQIGIHSNAIAGKITHAAGEGLLSRLGVTNIGVKNYPDTGDGDAFDVLVGTGPAGTPIAGAAIIVYTLPSPE